MAAIEPLLGIVQMKKANGLLLTSDEVPRLLTDEASVPLTMPPLSGGMLDDLVKSVLAPEQRDELARAGRVQSTYASQPHGSFAVDVQAAHGKVTLTLSTRTPAAAHATPVSPRSSPLDGSLEPLLDQAVERRASDVLLSAGARPLMRVDSALVELTAPPVSEDGLLAACEPFLGTAQRRQLDEAGSVDFAVVHPHDDGQIGRAHV